MRGFVWVMVVSAVACALATRLVLPRLARWQGVAPGRFDDCPPLWSYQEAKRGIPTMGGVVVLAIGSLVAALAGGLASSDGWVVFAVLLGFGAMGFLDDWLKFRDAQGRGLRCRPKLLAALAIGAVATGARAWASGDRGWLRLPGLEHGLDLGWLGVPFGSLVIAGSAHAVNLTDGMDGLATGCMAIALMGFGALAWAAMDRHETILPWCASLAGACIGFLWFNGFPASVFLGDVGALGLGAALGIIGFLMGASAWLVIIGGVFVVEAMSVMLQVASYKWRGGRRLFRVAPLHHHFQVGGISEPKLVLRFWLVAALLAVLGGLLW